MFAGVLLTRWSCAQLLMNVRNIHLITLMVRIGARSTLLFLRSRSWNSFITGHNIITFTVRSLRGSLRSDQMWRRFSLLNSLTELSGRPQQVVSTLQVFAINICNVSTPLIKLYLTWFHHVLVLLQLVLLLVNSCLKFYVLLGHLCQLMIRARLEIRHLCR